MSDVAVRAGIDVYERTLRYAEVEQHGTRYRLLRLGSCNFDFHVAHELLRAEQSPHLATVSEALGDIFAGSVAMHLHVALHPPDCHSFFAPLPADLPADERRARLEHEARLLTGEPLRLHEEVLHTEERDGSRRQWVHALGLSERAGRHLDRVLEHAPPRACLPRLSMHGAAHAALRLAARDEVDEATLLVVGRYPSHLELALCREGRWHFGHHAPPGPPADVAYFALALLRHLGLDRTDLARLYLYGTEETDPASFGVFEEVFEVTPRSLDALDVLDIDRSNLNARFRAEPYVPCIGAAL